MGWENEHLYEFKVGKRYVSELEPRSWVDIPGSKTEDASAVRLSDLAPRARTAFTYLFDMGDSWSHQVRVEKVLPGEPEASDQRPPCQARGPSTSVAQPLPGSEVQSEVTAAARRGCRSGRSRVFPGHARDLGPTLRLSSCSADKLGDGPAVCRRALSDP